MSKPARITSVQFHQFKAFAGYALTLDRLNILVGANNSGKSTIIGALRALSAALRVARSRPPERLDLTEGPRIGYRINESSLPISLENVHTDYGATESKITFVLSNRNRLHLVFPETEGCFLIPEAPGETVRSVATFKQHFPVTLTVIPVLGPVEHRELRREKETVVAGLATHRASRHFRSYWYHFPDGFETFADLVRNTWPGMDIQRPEIEDMTGELSMFCLEDRMTRELYWAGFGFQIWCQILTHLSRVDDSGLVVIDEPEVYLHPDVQRQLLGILRDMGADVLIATHSTEIMAEADPTEIVLVDKRKRVAERLRDVAGVQRALDSVGSVQNITLTALARNRRVLFVEGDDDYRLLRRFARRLGLLELAAGFGITSLESGGFSSWRRVTALAGGITQTLGTPLTIGAVYDRDYFSPEEIADVTASLSNDLTVAHVHDRKEIENYLLVPDALDRAIAREVLDRATRIGVTSKAAPSSVELLREITDPMKDDVQSQLIGRRTTYLRSTGRDPAVITRETLAWFTPRWDDIVLRLALVPGKEVLRTFRGRVQAMLSISLTDARIVDAFHRNDILPDLVVLLEKMETFRKTSN